MPNVRERRRKDNMGSNVITRVEYYKRLIQQLKKSISLSCWLEHETDGRYYDEYDAYSFPEAMKTDSHFVVRAAINQTNMNFAISEEAFDKYYLPMFEYESKRAVEYREEDIAISVSNIKYILMQSFAETYLNPRKD